MKVGHSGSYPIQKNESTSTQKTNQNSTAQGIKKNQAPSNHEVAKDSSSVRSEISPQAREFSQSKRIANQAHDVREDRVADLKSRIADGSYEIDVDAVADRLVEDHLGMSGIH